jgi:uncharacterized protein
MLTTVAAFRDRVDRDCTGLVAQLQELTGRYGEEEASAWKASLRKLSSAFRSPAFSPLHLYFGSRGHLALEYQLPAAASWCDVVLLGRHRSTPAAVILELKDWQTAGDQPGSYEGLVHRHGGEALHPSDQVRGYVEYCQRFHSTVQDFGAAVHGCVLFTRDRWTAAYTAEPNARLAAEYPLFTTEGPAADALPRYFSERLTETDERFASAFAEGTYRQDRGFMAQIGQQILHAAESPFVLLDGQRRALSRCLGTVQDAFLNGETGTPPKRVIIVKGPPGAGKSVVAARLWASLVTDRRLPEGDVILTTTSSSQNRNWSYLFDQAAKASGARGVVRKATAYSPITTQRLGRLRKTHGKEFLADAGRWRDHLLSLRRHREPFQGGAEDNANLVSIVDEAHALINPEHSAGRGQFGFVVSTGPQAYHIIRSSMLSVFLLDPAQGFRTRENTSLADLRLWSRELGAGDPLEIDLNDTQFRSAGSREYVAWVESVLAGAPPEENQRLARVFTSQGMDVRLYEEPVTWEADLREQIALGRSARLLSTYSRAWKTYGVEHPHDGPAGEMDFHEPYEAWGKSRHWSRVWNYVPFGNDYTWFVAANPKGRIANDPLCEVGCPYAVRGFDYDVVGILWLDDLLWRGGRWIVNTAKVHETGISSITSKARTEQRRGTDGPYTKELIRRVQQAYRIVFTRAIRGVGVWVPDTETREYVLASLRG